MHWTWSWARFGWGIILYSSVGLANNGAKFAKPLEQPMVPIFVSEDRNIPFGQCSGTVINKIPQVITAAHCLLGNNRFVKAAEIFVGVLGDRVAVSKIAIHPRYEILRNLVWELAAKKDTTTRVDLSDDRFDLAVLTLAPGTKVPSWVPLSPSAPLEDQPVWNAEWGFLLPPGDFDGDRVENNNDVCFGGVREKKISEKVERTGPRAGCEKEGEPQLAFTDLGWDLRFGPARTDTEAKDGIITVSRKLPNGVHNQKELDRWHAKVTPGANGSGGSLFDYWGSLAGVVKGTKLSRIEGDWTIEGFFVDLNEKSNEEFLKRELTEVTYRKEFDDQTNYKFRLTLLSASILKSPGRGSGINEEGERENEKNDPVLRGRRDDCRKHREFRGTGTGDRTARGGTFGRGSATGGGTRGAGRPERD